ncbi:MAG: Na+/H+ antiporter subunit E [Bacteroidales bacterium]
MKYLALFIITLVFWLLVTFSLALANIVVGVIAALITSYLFGRYFVTDVRKFLQPRRYAWLILYIFIFLWECIKANFDVAYRVLHPAMPIKPGIVRVQLEIKTDIAKTMLANSITMTPGTIAVDVKDDIMYVHWIYVTSEDPEVYTQKVSGRFENYIKKIFE